MKRTKNGFTLVELLAVIVILAIILVIAVPSVVNYFSGAKSNTEQVFLGNLEKAIDIYIENNKTDFDFSSYEECKNDSEGTVQCYIEKKDGEMAKVFFNTSSITLKKLEASNIMKNEDIINPKNKNTCDENTEIKIYRDSDYVYCYRVDLDCVFSEEKELEDEIKYRYDINTCREFVAE